MWNRTGSLINKENLKFNRNKIHVQSLTQLDNGYYNLRRKNNYLISRKKLQVEGNGIKLDVFLYVIKNMIQSTLFHTAKEVYLTPTDKERLFIPFPLNSKTWTLTYISDGDDEEHTLVDKGIQVRDSYIYVPFKRRFSKYDDGVDIDPVESRDSGTFYFKDPNGNLAETVRLEVIGEQKEIGKSREAVNIYLKSNTCFLFCRPEYLPTYVYIIVPVSIILALICCCCCVKKCCCKRSSSKRNESAPAVQHQVSFPSGVFVWRYELVF